MWYQRLIFSLWILLSLYTGGGYAQSLSILTWNIQDLGQSKDEWELFEMAHVMKSFDIIAIQEVVAKDPRGAQAVAKIADMLNRMGSKWDYRISDPTQSPNNYLRERYAFIWKSNRIQLQGRPFLDQVLARQCFREPYLAKFRDRKTQSPFYVVNFHSRRFDQGPEQEIQYFSQYPSRFTDAPVIIAGDFNLDERHNVWKPLYAQGYTSALTRSPTTLKRACNLMGNYLNHSIDNIYYPIRAFQVLKTGKVDFVRACDYLAKARGISDHLPVYLSLTFAAPPERN